MPDGINLLCEVGIKSFREALLFFFSFSFERAWQQVKVHEDLEQEKTGMRENTFLCGLALASSYFQVSILHTAMMLTISYLP